MYNRTYNIILLVSPFSPFFSDPDVATSAFFSAVDRSDASSASSLGPAMGRVHPWIDDWAPWTGLRHWVFHGCFTGQSKEKLYHRSVDLSWFIWVN